MVEERMLRLIDEAMALLEQLEGDIAGLSEKRELRGAAYRMYTRVVRIADNLRELRALITSKRS